MTAVKQKWVRCQCGKTQMLQTENVTITRVRCAFCSPKWPTQLTRVK